MCDMDFHFLFFICLMFNLFNGRSGMVCVSSVFKLFSLEKNDHTEFLSKSAMWIYKQKKNKTEMML